MLNLLQYMAQFNKSIFKETNLKWFSQVSDFKSLLSLFLIQWWQMQQTIKWTENLFTLLAGITLLHNTVKKIIIILF